MLSPVKYLDLQGLEEVWAKITEKFGTSEYSLIEYLESHATSKTNGPYIDTGVTLTDSCTIEAMFQFQNMDNHTNLCLYGSRQTTTATSNARIGFGWSENINNFRFDYAKENNTVSVSNPLDTFVLKQQVNNLYLDDDLKAQATHATFTTPYTMPIFAQKTADVDGLIGECTNLKLWYFKITDGSTQMDLRPCRHNPSGELGLLDTVSGQFFTNSGTGLDFTAGPVIVVDDPTTPETVLSVEKGGTGCTNVPDIRTMLFNFPEDDALISFVNGQTSTVTGIEPVSASNVKAVMASLQTSVNSGKSWQGHSTGYRFTSMTYNDRCSFVPDFSDGITYRNTDSRFILPGKCNLKVEFTMKDFNSVGTQGSNPRALVRVRLMRDNGNTAIDTLFNYTFYGLSIHETVNVTKTFNNVTDSIVWFELYVSCSGYYGSTFDHWNVDYSSLKLTTV